MKKLDCFLLLLFCSSVLALNAGAHDKEVCSKEYFPGEEAVVPSMTDDANPATPPDPSDSNPSSQVPITPPEPTTDKQYVPASPTSPTK